MRRILDVPLAVFALSLVALWLSAQIGTFLRNRLLPLEGEERRDLDLVIPAALTLLGLLIGFCFSLASNRYDQRKNSEEAEAKAIRTEYVRADLLSAPDAARVRELLKNYLDLRIRYFETRDKQQLGRIDAYTTQLQTQLWSAVEAAADKQQRYPSLVVSGVNDVLNSQEDTQAAWEFRLPVGAWLFMFVAAIFSALLSGYSRRRKGITVFAIVPLAVSISLFLIADLESPRRGLIRVAPTNLITLSQSLQAQ
jgi:hypothetical protein